MIYQREIIFFLRFSIAMGISRKYPFTVSGVCYQANNYVIHDVYGIESMMTCSALCMQDRCCSLWYDTASQRCITYPEYLQNKNSGCSSTYLEKKAPHCEGRLVHRPSTPNACNFGYSYDASNGLCVTACESYGSTFGVFPGSDHASINPDDAQTCKDACLDTTDFVCRTASYNRRLILNECYLSVETPFTQPSVYGEYSVSTLFQRNCA